MGLGRICTRYAYRSYTHRFFRKPTDVFTGTYWYIAVMDSFYKDLDITIESKFQLSH
jgi:hypothetical protein